MLKKSFLIIFISFPLFIFSQKTNVSIIPNIPSSVEAGSKFTVELTVYKGSILGFAKIQQIA